MRAAIFLGFVLLCRTLNEEAFQHHVVQGSGVTVVILFLAFFAMDAVEFVYGLMQRHP
jgi:hypothetical protein